MSFDFVASQLAEQKAQHRYRQLTCIGEQAGRELIVDGKRYLNFSSNDYLGLQHEPALIKAMQQGAERFGIGSTGSSLITGYHYAHQTLSESLCDWLDKPRCLLFSSGFAANTGLLSALGQKNVHLFLDKLSHASLIDGAYHSQAQVKRFKHNDIHHLSTLLNKADENKLIISEGVFSMDGDKAPVADLAKLTKLNHGLLAIDDAHAIGVIGEHGKGSLASNAEIDIVTVTFGKALATSGAAILCSDEMADYLTNFCREYIYSTAISPAMAYVTQQAVKLAQQDDWRREKIAALSFQLKNELAANIEVLPTESSIHAIMVGSAQKALIASEALKQRGIWLTAIRPPTVAQGKSRLRVTICASHKSCDISYLAKNINEVLEACQH